MCALLKFSCCHVEKPQWEWRWVSTSTSVVPRSLSNLTRVTLNPVSKVGDTTSNLGFFSGVMPCGRVQSQSSGRSINFLMSISADFPLPFSNIINWVTQGSLLHRSPRHHHLTLLQWDLLTGAAGLLKMTSLLGERMSAMSFLGKPSGFGFKDTKQSV